MGYLNLRECVKDLEKTGQLIRINVEVDPHLEAAAIHRRVVEANGPALLFTNVRNCQFPMVSNLFGTLDRARHMFRDQLAAMENLIHCKVAPEKIFTKPWKLPGIAKTLWHGVPKVRPTGPVLNYKTTISKLPQLVCWPRDGGAFITLPQVFTEDVQRPGWRHSNIGMYRIQLSGNDYQQDQEIGLHYQLHRGIGIHHCKARESGLPFRVAIAMGGPPALSLAAVMPLPEAMPEISFAGILGGRRMELTPFPMDCKPVKPILVPSQADFVIVGVVDPNQVLPEGPFGDHLGYYSLKHDFPVLKVEAVYHRQGAIWPFTVVGRPPQEDTVFGKLIHELTGPLLPVVLPGVHAVHAVDASGVHPLLLAIGSERYTPYQERIRPQELLTSANAILGQGQLSLAKFLLIVAREDAPDLDIDDIPAFFRHLLERVDHGNDLHFHTHTTIDTLDYTGNGLNQGSKLVIAAVGPRKRILGTETPRMFPLPNGFTNPKVALPGIMVIQAPRHSGIEDSTLRSFCASFANQTELAGFPWMVLVDDSDFAAGSQKNFLWNVFTKTNPATDIDGIGAILENKHWGCTGPMVIDARNKPHHAPALEEPPHITRFVDSLASKGGPLHGVI